MKHHEKLDELMSTDQKIEGLILEEYSINLGGSHAALDCRQFMQDMAVRLATGRISEKE